MPVIRVEFVPIKVMHLGMFGLDHLQLVFDQQIGGSPGQDSWYVIEGIKGKEMLEVEGKDGVTTLSAANEFRRGFDLVAAIGTPATRGSRILPLLSPLASWFTMASYAAQIDREFVYSALGMPGTIKPTCNSSSLISSLLFAVGLDVFQVMPLGVRSSPGIQTLLGTHADETMQASTTYQTILSGRGSDVIRGSDLNDKLYGGRGDDLIFRSRGTNVIHGGQYGLDYSLDGTDTVDYAGAGRITFAYGRMPLENSAPDYVVTCQGSIDYLYSIERVQWSGESDELVLTDGIEAIEDGILFKMGGQGAGGGDSVDLSQIQEALLVVPTEDGAQIFVRPDGAADPHAGTWLESVEALITSHGADRIYAADGMLVVNGADGDDLIDARQVTAGSGASPAGYDIEIEGGAGADTLVANAGRTVLRGGDGADRFVLSALSSDASQVEVVIEGADAADRLYVPHNFFNGSGGAFDGSALMPVLGGFGDLSQTGNGRYANFDWMHEDQYWYGSNFTQGVIPFMGAIWFELQGGDLLIHFYEGWAFEETVTIDDVGTTRTFVFNEFSLDKETVVRIANYEDGDLGLTFYDLGPGTPVDLGDGRSGLHYDGFDAAVDYLTSNGTMQAALEAAPSRGEAWAPSAAGVDPAETTGSEADDIIAAPGSDRQVIDAGAGNDSVTGGEAGDTLDGGEGDDRLAGGAGNDTYYVDSSGDVVVETEGGGVDTVYSTVDMLVPVNVEALYLAGAARVATGGDGDETLVGNETDNILGGEAGDDTLVGGPGDDALSGGTGGDRYVYTPGDGFDTIFDDGDADGIDTLVLNRGVTIDNIAVWRLAGRPDDILLELDSGGRILILGYAQDEGAIEHVAFGDGAVWSAADLIAHAAQAPFLANQAPDLKDDLSYIVQSTQLTIPAAALLENDGDFEGDALHIVALQGVSNANVFLDADGNIAFWVADGFEGTAEFRYTAADSQGATSTADVAIYVTAPPEAGGPIDGTRGDDVIEGTDAADVIHGLAGRDAITGGAGNDEIDGDQGADRLSGGQGDDTIVGGEGVDVLDGGEGDDLLDGASGEASRRTDRLIGGAGDDRYVSNGDVVVERAGEGHDVVLALASVVLRADQSIEEMIAMDVGVVRLWGNGGDQVLSNAEGVAAELRGMGGEDVVKGNSEGDRLYGGAGDDILDGAAGADRLFGQAGADTVTGGAGDDGISGGAGNDVIYGDAAPGDAAAASLGTGNDRLFGDAGDDVILGGGGGDVLYGGAGADRLDGGEGDDLIYGNGQGDVFVFAGAFGRDRIADFGASDRIDLSAFHLAYADLAFASIRGGIEVTALRFGDGNRIVVSGAHDPIAEQMFRF